LQFRPRSRVLTPDELPFTISPTFCTINQIISVPPTITPSGLRFQTIDKRYAGLFALRGISLEISPGECVVIAGRNGSGKTTLLRIAARLVRPTSGMVSYLGDASSRPGYVAHATMVYDELTAAENLLLFAKLQNVPQAAARAEELLHSVGLFDRRDSRVRTFSRGMRQRMAIARALVHRPSILLFDEPSTGLDPLGIAWLAKTLSQIHKSGCTVVMSLHGESEISALAARAIQLDAGSVVADTNSGAAFYSILTCGGA
jgi:ABC-type multidrug transport system ATPase subunit